MRENFTKEFLESRTVLNPLVYACISLLERGDDIYSVFEFAITRFVDINEEQIKTIEKLIELMHAPTYVGDNGLKIAEKG